ncbi:hypothetical protein GQ53DRAFT_802859 [Thozetella sp. PMI_491]|nr:hypothetical protein GQ53DRAFT_802859 [Thozetella sp. PMI_491]
MANWTLGYVIVGLIPVVFVGIAIWATIEERRSRQTPAEIDLEMQDYRRFWFPWTGAADDAEPSTKQVNNGGSSASVARAAPPAYPAVPMSPVQARSLALESVPSWIRRDPQSLVGGMTNGGSSTQDPKGKKKAWMAEPWPASHEPAKQPAGASRASGALRRQSPRAGRRCQH